MKRDGKNLLLLSGLALCTTITSLEAVTSGSPYNGIVDRNVFALKPPAPPVDPEANKPAPPPSTLTLTGITTILGNKRALLHSSLPPRPPEPAKEDNYMLTEGQRDGSVEVLEINEREGSVKVKNGGQISTLTFEKNGAKLLASAAPVPPPGSAVQVPAPGMALPGSAPGGPGGLRSIPTRTMRSSPQGSSSAGNSTSVGPATSGAIFQPQRSNLSAEEETIIIEARRAHAIDQGDESAPLFPPTELTPEGSPGMPQAPGGPAPSPF